MESRLHQSDNMVQREKYIKISLVAVSDRNNASHYLGENTSNPMHHENTTCSDMEYKFQKELLIRTLRKLNRKHCFICTGDIDNLLKELLENGLINEQKYTEVCSM
jgi:hypothetical protein